MTYTHKLASRLALLRDAVILSLPLAGAACKAASLREGFAPPDTPDTTVVAVVVTPTAANIATGQVIQFRVYGHNTRNDSLNVAVDWTATGGTVSSTGAYSSTSPGTFKVKAKSRGNSPHTDSATVTVTSATPVLTAIHLNPSSTSVQAGGTQQFSVTGDMSDGSTTTPSVTYSATGGTVSSGGLFTAGTTTGTFRVIAAQSGGGLADTASVSITTAPPVLTAIVLTPASATIQSGTSLQFNVNGIWTNGGSGVPAVTFSATGGTVTASGLYTAGATAGTFSVIAVQTGGTLADTSVVTVSTTPVLTQVILTPATASVPTGGTQQFTVSGRMSDGSTVTPAVTLTATGGTISGSGLYTAGSTGGTFRVIATQTGGTLADTSTVTVTAPAPVLTAVVLSPATATVQAGGTQQFSVTGVWTNGGSGVPAVTYTVTGGTITSNGLYTAGGTTGSFRVIATQVGGSLVDTSSVTITAPPPPPPPGSFLQNKPATLATVILDQPFTTESPWTELFEVPTGAINIVNDATAPRSPSSVLEFKFLNSSYSGSGAGSLNVNYTATNEVYLSFLWYASNPFTWANYSNKLLYVGDPGGGGSNWIIELACHEGSSYNGNFFILHNNGSDGGYGVADGNFSYPWGYGEGSGNPDHNGALPIYKVQRGHWYEIEFYAKKGVSGSRTGNITYLWARDITAGEQTSTQLVAMNDANGNVDQSGHVWGHFQLQSILGGGTVDISSTLGQYYHIDQFTAYKP